MRHEHAHDVRVGAAHDLPGQLVRDHRLPSAASRVLTPRVLTLPYVEVRTADPVERSSTMTNLFTQAAGQAGNPDESSSDVHACSRAAWGQPGGGTATTPITMSVCEWQSYTAGGTSWVADPPTGAVARLRRPGPGRATRRVSPPPILPGTSS